MLFQMLGGALVVLIASASAPAAHLSFSDQTPGSAGLEPDPNPYTTEHGLETGQSILFSGFVSNDLGIDPFDHTPDDDNANRMLLADYVGSQMISFAIPAEVSSFYISLGNGAGESALIQGSLAEGGQVALYSDFLPWGEWVEITSGAGLLLSGLSFSGFEGGYIDDMTVDTSSSEVPEPCLSGLVATALLLSRSWHHRSQRRKENRAPLRGCLDLQYR